jgi:hypothetical protein
MKDDKNAPPMTLNVGQLIRLLRRHPDHTPVFMAEETKQVQPVEDVKYQRFLERVVIVVGNKDSEKLEPSCTMCMGVGKVAVKMSTGYIIGPCAICKSNGEQEAKDQQWNFNHLYTCEACGVIMVKSPDHCPNCGECNSFKYL